MRKEKEKCLPRCIMCHQLQPTHSKYKRKYASLDDMPVNTPSEKTAKIHRRYKDEKYAYVLKRKIEIGMCMGCSTPVTESTAICFDFAHNDATTKKGKQDSVSNVCNSRISMKTCKPRLDELMGTMTTAAECRLLCKRCHKSETLARNNY